MTEIVELHEELLGELHRAVPHSEYTQAKSLNRDSEVENGLGAVPENDGQVPWPQNLPGMMAEPQVAAETAKIFIAKVQTLDKQTLLPNRPYLVALPSPLDAAPEVLIVLNEVR